MKKIITLLVALLTIASVLFCFTACKDKTPEEPTTNNITTTDNIRYGYSAEVTSTSLKVYKDDVFVQELSYPESKMDVFVLGFAQNHVAFQDMNFDGNEDICLTISASNGIFNYCCWIFDSEKGEFVYNETLSSFTSMTLDTENKQVVVTEKNGDTESFVIYEWINGELKKLTTKNELPETVTNTVLGSTSSDSTASRVPETTKNNNINDNNNPEKDTSVPNIITPQPEVTKPSGGGSDNGVNYAPDIYGDEWY